MPSRKPPSARKGKSNVIHQRNSGALLVAGLLTAFIAPLAGLAGALGTRGSQQILMISSGAVGLITGLSCVGGWFYRAAMLPRLVFRKDRLEYVRGRGTVIGNIPYDNIYNVELGQRSKNVGYDEQHGGTITFESSFLTIFLWEREDEDTWWPQFQPRRRGSEVVITPGFEKRVEVIGNMIRERVERYRAGDEDV
jgi:hypothetical protein